MKKIAIILTILFSFTNADSVLLMKKGWQLIGSSTDIENVSKKFNNPNVEQIWHFDATTQKWLGYSPDENISERMRAKHISTLKTLKNWHGFWIKNRQDWTLTFKSHTLNKEPNSTNNSDIIELKKGWNLVSLPVDTVLSADIFDGMLAWKYNSKNNWELSDDENLDEDFPRLGHIKNSDGIWVKAAEDTNISVMEESSKLHNFANKEQMESYIKEMAIIYRRPYCGIEPFFISDGQRVYDSAVMSDSPAESDNASGTNLQEDDVDESDIVKHDGTNIFYIGKDEKNRKNHINVTTFTTLASGDTPELNRIRFDNNRTIDSFYLSNNTLIVLSTGVNRTHIDMFNVSDINDIKHIQHYAIDGRLKNSRVLNNTLYTITSFSPTYTISYPKEYLVPSDSCKRLLKREIYNVDYYDTKYAECYNIIEEDGRYYRYNYDAPKVTFTKILAQIEGDGLAKQDLITPKKLYASSKQNQVARMTSISSFSLDTNRYKTTTSYVGESHVEYASSKALYLLSSEYPFFFDFNNYKQRSMVYKFNFDETISYRAVGSVYGNVLNQFSLSEYNDILRLATTEGFSWGQNGTKNTLYTLKENNGLLHTQGVLSGLGKEGESIKSVRFMGTRAYIVTFRTTDPLYTIDISNPAIPKKMGELEVSGFSEYLHPIGEDKLLGIGRETDPEGGRLGVKIELFDVSDFENPSSLDTIVLLDTTSSELSYNHKALAYRASDSLFAFPYSDYTRPNNYLGIYQVKEDTLVSYEALTASSKNWGEHRGIIFDLNDTTYVSFFSDDTVISTVITKKDN